MSNEKNLAALIDLLLSWDGEPPVNTTVSKESLTLGEATVGEIAEHLASHGALVPSALTEEQINGLAETAFGVEDHSRIRAELERIAKGDDEHDESVRRETEGGGGT